MIVSMHRFLFRAFSLAVILVGSAINMVNAGVVTEIYGNLGSVETTSTSNTVGYLSFGLPNQFQSQGFSVGGSAWTIETIEVGLVGMVSPSPVVQIFSDLQASPGSALATFTSTSALSVKQIYSFTGSFAAQASTNYWVVLSNLNSESMESYEWYTDDSFSNPTGKNSSGLSYLGTKESNNGGQWTNTIDSLSIRLSGSTSSAPPAVPEPSMMVIGTLFGLGGLMAKRRRKK